MMAMFFGRGRGVFLLATSTWAFMTSPPRWPLSIRSATLADENTWRSQFPALEQDIVPGRPLIYFDSGATAQKPRCVLEAVEAYYIRDNANVHRGAHTLATRATEAYELARAKVATFVNAESSREIVWTKGATEAINLVANAWGDATLESGDEIVLTIAEHHANLVPWQLLALRKGLVLKYAQLDPETGEIDADHLVSLVTRRTKLVALVHVSNVLGSFSPVEAAVAAVSRHAAPGCAVLLDACQSAPHWPIDVQRLGCDFLVASGHKLYGPTGVGVLWAKYERLEAMRPWQGGGEMIDTVTLEGSTFAAPPARFEAGTPPIAQAVGLGVALDFLQDIGLERVARYEAELAARLDHGLRQIPGLTVYGPPASKRSVPIFAFNAHGIHASDLSFFLDQEGVATRAGHHCTQPLHDALETPSGSVRASLALYNTPEEIDAFLAHVRSVLDFFGDVNREVAA